MDQQPDSSFPTVYHEAEDVVTAMPSPAPEERPRLFALLDFDEDEDDECGDGAVALYGLALPCGVAATITPEGRLHGQWTDPDRLADRLGLSLVWFEPTGASD